MKYCINELFVSCIHINTYRLEASTKSTLKQYKQVQTVMHEEKLINIHPSVSVGIDHTSRTMPVLGVWAFMLTLTLACVTLS